MALIVPLLAITLFSVVDLGDYVRRRMQVEAAGQSAVGRVWSLCNTASSLPAMKNCTGLSVAMTTAAQQTSLGSNVTLGSTSEGYYCVSSSGTLVQVGTSATAFGAAAAAPTGAATNCSTVGATAGTPALYIQTTASHTYTPIVGVSIAAVLPSPITKTAWMRLN